MGKFTQYCRNSCALGLDSRPQLKNEGESNRKMMQEIQKNVLRKAREYVAY